MTRQMPLLLSLVLLASGPLLAGTIYVDDDNTGGPWDGSQANPYQYIQDGITNADPGDTVQVADGIYRGALNKDLDFGGKAITVQSENGAASTIIDCQDSGRGFYFDNGETTASVVDGFTIRNGSAETGAGICCEASSPTITNCRIQENAVTGEVAEGGGIYGSESSPIITDCWISGNTASGEYADGSGLCFRGGSPTLTNCTISDNSATAVTNGGGGGIYCWQSSPTLTGCRITGNSCPDGGGGICCYWGIQTITDCTITGNSASRVHADGGGIYCLQASSTITGCIISGNSSPDAGGGIGCEESALTIANCTVTGNTAPGYGGGIWCRAGSPAIANCVIGGNQGDDGGGICFTGESAPTVTNCTISANSAGDDGGGIYCLLSDPTVTNCILWGNESDQVYAGPGSSPSLCYCDVQGGWSGAGSGNINADPLFVYPAGSNYRLRPGSPCVDAGTSDGAPTEDMEGRPRYDDPTTPNAGGGTPDYYDIGAYEFKAYYVNGDPAIGNDAYDGLEPIYNPVSGHGPELTIQAGINDASDGDTVCVAPWTYTGAGNRDLDFADGLPSWQTRHIALISNGGPEVTIIDCEGTAVDRHLGFYMHSYEQADSVVDGFTIKNGYDFRGGAVRCDGSSPTIMDCIITGNTAIMDGGGIFYDGFGLGGPSPTITSCEISGNTAGHYGGGISWFAEPVYAPSIISDCLIKDNSADVGGGISCAGFSSGNLTIANCIVTGNHAAYGGGGIMCWDLSDALVTDCTISGNTAAAGGGICCNYSSATIRNCLVFDNSATEDGGGVACSEEHQQKIVNCTIAFNSAGESGGGINCNWEADVTMTDCVLWGNQAPQGHEMSLTRVYGPTILTVSHCDVQGGDSEAYIEATCILNYDITNIDQDPLFVIGPLHDYYLSQTAAGQLADSPCVDAGSDTAANLGLDALTTRTDGVPDAGIVDMGYHAPPAIFGDVDGNGVVDGLDLTAVMTAWDTQPGDPLWDPDADLDCNGIVDGLDLTAVISNWTTGFMAASAAAPEPMAEDAAQRGTGTVMPHRRGSRRGKMRRK